MERVTSHDMPKDDTHINDVYYRAILSKDTRFDGVFFVGVKSTGIYCRPVCPVKPPKRQSCVFFQRATEAEVEGFRACFRCRPELAPGHSSVDASSRLVQRAVTHINEGYLNHHTTEELAQHLEVTGRHLRRVMGQELGMTPKALAQSRRIAIAKQLLQDTQLSITDIAYTSGFSSVRRFNDAFKARFQRTPSSLRNASRTKENDGETIQLRLDYRPPLPWSVLLAHADFRKMEGIEWIDGDAYYRTAVHEDAHGWLSIQQHPQRHALQVTLSLSLLQGVIPLMARLRRRFDLDAHPDEIATHLRSSEHLQEIVDAIPGLRLHGAFDPFAQMIRVILGQRISVKAATTICNRLIQCMGTPVTTPIPSLNRSFPTPEQLAECNVRELLDIGVPEARANAIQSLAKAIHEGSIPLIPQADSTSYAEALLAIKGIGPWTVRSILMRIAGEPDVFPASDLELRKALGHCTAKEAEAMAEAWRPWRTYAALYLWQAQASKRKNR